MRNSSEHSKLFADRDSLGALVTVLTRAGIMFKLEYDESSALLECDDMRSLNDYSASTLEKLFPQVKTRSTGWGDDRSAKVRLTFTDQTAEKLVFPTETGEKVLDSV